MNFRRFWNLKGLTFFVFIVSICSQSTLVSSAEVASIPTDRSKFHIFLLMGQSNMEGANSTDGEMDTVTDPRIMKLNASGFWQVASDPITNNASEAVGPGFQFAKTLIAQDPEITVGLIPLAVGGTAISYWSLPSDGYWQWAHAVRVAQRDGTLKGILWHQGEGDTGDTKLTYGYRKNLKALIDMIRKDLQNPYLPFIVGGLTSSTDVVDKLHYRGIVGDALKEVGTQFLNAGYVRSQDVPFIASDPVHFTSDGQRIMGERYAIEYLRVAGFWTEKGKEWLDSEALDNGDGWKYHPELGIYHDEKFPLIKHAQLGWLTVSIDQDRVIRLDSPFIGKFRILQEDGVEDQIGIFTENLEDPEYPSYGELITVNLLQEPGETDTFYDKSIESYLDRLPGMTVVEDIWDLNRMMEAEYEQIQWALQYLRNEIAAYDVRYWSNMRRWVDDVVYHRNYCNVIGWEGYHYASEHETGNLRSFWMNDTFLRRLYEIDDFVRESQDEYQVATDVILSNQ